MMPDLHLYWIEVNPNMQIHCCWRGCTAFAHYVEIVSDFHAERLLEMRMAYCEDHKMKAETEDE